MTDPQHQADASWAAPTLPIDSRPDTGESVVPMMPLVVEPTASGAPKRSRSRVIGAFVGVAALVAAGGFAVITVTGNETAGGAASPTEVGTALTTALDNEDVLGVIDLLLPGERETFRQPLTDLVDNLARLDVLSDEASLGKIGGIDMQLSDITVTAIPTNVDDIVNIEINGSATVSVNGSEVPLGGLLIDKAFGGTRPDLDVEPESDEIDDATLTVVERDGRWYLSAFYTIAEQIRSDSGDDLDVPAVGVVAEGADSPEGAVDAMLEAVSDLDIERMIALLDPAEAEALQRYAPLFVEEAQAGLEAAGLTWSITDTAYTVSDRGSGSQQFVFIDSVSFSGSYQGIELSMIAADGCATFVMDGQDLEFCPGSEAESSEFMDAWFDLFGLDATGLEPSPAVTDLVETVAEAFADAEPSGIAVHEVNGAWYVSPIGWFMASLDSGLDALDRRELGDVVDGYRTVFEEMLQAIEDAESAFEDEFDDEFDYTALDKCYEEVEASAGVACALEGLAAGTIDPVLVDAPVRFPECGGAQEYWTGLWDMSDEDYIALVERVSPCLLALVESGAVEVWELPMEIIAPECTEGRNWYSSTDDEYDTRFSDCAWARADELAA